LKSKGKFIMNRSSISAVALTVAALFAGNAMAADSSVALTRDQVKAELAQAIRLGDFAVNDAGQTAREVNPSLYPAKTAGVAKTRAQVQAELAQAIRAGNFAVNDAGQTAREVTPSLYPSQTVVAGKSRSEVKAELAQAIRTGDFAVNEAGQKANEVTPGVYRNTAASSHAGVGVNTAS
jgi:predicted kinase